MNRHPLVSVAIPAFNAAGTIATAVDSVLAQTCPDFEVIVCDDASTDDTATIVDEYDDDRVRLLRNVRNAGEGRTRDRAIAAAKGRWIAVLDADDAWLPSRLEKLLCAADGRRDYMVFDDLMICHDTRLGMVQWRPLRGRNAFGTTGRHAREVPLPSYLRSERLLIKPLFPTHVVRENGIQHSERRFGADTEYFIRLAHAGLGFAYVPEPLYLYRVTPGSATGVAKGHHLMRECIEACASLAWKQPEVMDAFRYKIAALRDNERLYEIADFARRGEWIRCLQVLANYPRLLRILPRRGAKHLAYQVHRIMHSGAKR